ncbi:MAG TPA: tetratricopeptide repeat protein [Sphingomicrobium sp.]|nr:tetratricopeptide repeat protein [Sphingomicrobium sp.]
MILLAAAIAAATPAPPAQPQVQPLSEAAHAIEAGRLQQARIMIGNAVRAGERGPAIDRLLADLAYAGGDYAKALPAYLQALVGNSGDVSLYERAGISALKMRNMAQAEPLLERATKFPNATWRAWNARGAAADFRSDWAVADESYERAAALAPQRAEVFNNLGWSLLVRGRWQDALAALERAASLDPRSERIAHNLELARAALSQDLPQRRPGESDEDWAARLNDAGMIAKVRGDTKKATAAFAQAVEIRSQYYERAANNLAQVQRSR